MNPCCLRRKNGRVFDSCHYVNLHGLLPRHMGYCVHVGVGMSDCKQFGIYIELLQYDIELGRFKVGFLGRMYEETKACHRPIYYVCMYMYISKPSFEIWFKVIIISQSLTYRWLG